MADIPSVIAMSEGAYRLIVLFAQLDLLEIRDDAVFLDELWYKRISLVGSPRNKDLLGSRMKPLGDIFDNRVGCQFRFVNPCRAATWEWQRCVSIGNILAVDTEGTISGDMNPLLLTVCHEFNLR